MSANGIRLVCFDWGGVILRICRSWAEGCQAAGLPVRAEAASEQAIRRRRELSHRYQTGALGESEFFAGLAATTGGLYTPEECRRIHDCWLLHEYEGVAELVDELHALGHVETALLSNTNAAHWARHLPGPDGRDPDFPTAGRLHHRHGSHLLRLAKPEPQIYRAFEKQVGRRGAEIVFFDDLEDNIAAARAAGWRAERVDHEGDTAAQMRGHLRRLAVL